MPKTSTTFCCFKDLGFGFGAWSYFTLTAGERVLERTRRFETAAKQGEGVYAPGTERQHEIRWVYAAFHLMSQRLAHHRTEVTDRAVRRRAAREGRTVEPAIRAVGLRRIEETLASEAGSRAVEWSCQWMVRGHWRKQPYGPGRSEYRQVFVEAYVKGPQNLPLRAPRPTVFVAAR